jgi:hypothetical protein
MKNRRRPLKLRKKDSSDPDSIVDMKEILHKAA